MPAPEASVFGMGCSRRRGANSCQIHPSLSRVAWACVAKSPAVLFLWAPSSQKCDCLYVACCLSFLREERIIQHSPVLSQAAQGIGRGLKWARGAVPVLVT